LNRVWTLLGVAVLNAGFYLGRGDHRDVFVRVVVPE